MQNEVLSRNFSHSFGFFLSRFASPLDSNKKPLAPSVPLSEGHYLFLKTHIPASMDDSIKTTDMTEHIKYVDRERFMLAWGSEGSGVMFGAEQWHMLTEENGQTKYEAVAVMKGLVAHGVKRVMKQTARDLESSIQDMATSLQHVCE